MLDDQIVKLTSDEKEPSWWEAIVLGTMAQIYLLKIKDDDWHPLYAETQCCTAIASKDDGTTLQEVGQGFEEVIPQFTILI